MQCYPGAIGEAAGAGCVAEIDDCMRAGADVNEVYGRFAVPPLTCAVTHAHPAAAQALIAHKANINLKDNTGDTALIVASYYGFRNICKLLISSKANGFQSAKNAKTAVSVASSAGFKELSKLLDKKTPIDQWPVCAVLIAGFELCVSWYAG